MDMLEDNVADSERYAFLLGSALRNDDLEQFFCTYDSIIPKHLPEVQVEKIKERARDIADLPEDDFNHLVVKARDFSLAHGHFSLLPAVAMWTDGQIVTNHVLDEKENAADVTNHVLEEKASAAGDGSHVEEGREVHCPPCDLPKLDLHDQAPLSMRGTPATVRDADSGLLASSKTDPGQTGMSADEASEMEERGAHDYFPKSASVQQAKEKKDEAEVGREAKVKCQVSKSLSVGDMYDTHHYDEAVMVENDSDSIESPRSDMSGGGQSADPVLNRARGRVGREWKVMTKQLSDSEPQENIHKKLYAHKLFTTRKNVTRVRASSTSPVLRSKSLSSSPGAKGSSCRVPMRDDSSYFTPWAGPSGQSRHSPDYFDMPLSANPLSSLMKTSSYNLSSKGTASDTTEGKKKKKKKKEIKDENAQEGGSLIRPYDENGNPLPSVSHQQYLRLRQSPSSQQKASTDLSSNSDLATRKGDRHGMDSKTEDSKNSSSHTANGPAEKRKRKRNGPQAKQAEDYPDYVGNYDVDNLVKFINNKVSKKQLKKIGNPPGDGADHGTITVNSAHKNDKPRTNSKQLLMTGVGEHSEDGLTPASETTQLLRSAASLVSYSTLNDHSTLLPACKQIASVQTHTEDQEAVSQVAEKVLEDMGNLSASEKQLEIEEVTSPSSLKAVENHLSDSVGSEFTQDTELVKAQNQLNHILPTDKSASVGKREQTGEGKDKGKGKNGVINDHKDIAQSKNRGTIDNKKDDVHIVDNNLANKKSKAKSAKNCSKPESVSDKVPSAGVHKERKVPSSADTSQPKDSRKGVAAVLGSATCDSSAIQDAIHTDLISTSTPVNAPDEEFTVVSTKKKKRAVPNRTQNIIVQTSSHPSSYKAVDLSLLSSQMSSGTCSRHNHWESYGRRAVPHSQYRSSTPPPPSSVTKVPKAEREEMMQDLSHSAFPALNPSDRNCGLFPLVGQEARSLEDLPCGVGPLSFDKDSDKASSKSLPAVQAKGNKGRVNYPVSYASMASANTPRQSVDSSKAESVGSSMGDSNMEESPVTPTTAMKWKGSPQERRHSIGSAPEDLSKPVGGNSLQRTGSQEMLPRDKDCADKGSSIGLASPVTVPAVSSAASTLGCDTDAALCGQAQPIDSTSADSSHAVHATEQQTPAAVPMSQDNSIPANPVTSSSADTEMISLPTVASRVNTPPSFSNSSTSKSSSRSQLASGVTRCKVKMPKPVSNGNKKKIVIFYDSSEEESKGCDYIFGDLPVFCIGGGPLVMPPVSDEQYVNTSVTSGRESTTTKLVSPTRCPTTTSTTAANVCGTSHTSITHTVSSNEMVSDRSLSIPETSSSMSSAVRNEVNSSHSEAHFLIKFSSGLTSLKDQSVSDDSKPSDLSGQCDVNPADKLTSGSPAPSTRPESDEDHSGKSCDRDVNKPAKAPHIAGLNGIIPVQGLVVSQAAVVHTHAASTTLTPVVSTPTPIPAHNTNSLHAQAEVTESEDVPGTLTRESMLASQDSSMIQSAEREAAGLPSVQPSEDSCHGNDADSLQPTKCDQPVYLPRLEPVSLDLYQYVEEARKFIRRGWDMHEDHLRKNADKVYVFSLDTVW